MSAIHSHLDREKLDLSFFIFTTLIVFIYLFSFIFSGTEWKLPAAVLVN